MDFVFLRDEIVKKPTFTRIYAVVPTEQEQTAIIEALLDGKYPAESEEQGRKFSVTYHPATVSIIQNL